MAWQPILLAAILGVAATMTAAAGDAESRYDVVVYGATSGGITAAIQAKTMGKTVILVEPGEHVGGLSAGGLGATDIGNKAAIGGLSREFYRRIGRFYADPSAWQHEQQDASPRNPKAAGEREMWTFEPHVAERVFREWLAEAGVEVVFEAPLDLAAGGIEKDGPRIVAFRTEDGRRFAGSMFIDASYEGDLMAKAGVSYHVGREAASVYGESLNGIRTKLAHKHQFTRDVDPYVVPGNPASGLVPLVSPDPPGDDGDGDRRLQAYNFRMCTTDVPDNRRDWPKPDGYDETRYELLLRYFEAGCDQNLWNPVRMPNRKTDTNNNGAFSTDFIGGNYDYPEANHAERRRIVAEHRSYQQGLMWTLANHPRVPEKVRAQYRRYGLAKDEFVDNDNWPHQLYVREARRMISDYVMTQDDCQWKRSAEDPVGLAAYNMDSHNCQRHVTAAGFVRNEGDIQVGVKPYGIAYRSIRPRREECENLLVPVCLAASHIAYGSIRMEPVFMVLGQSAAAAAVLAIERGSSVQAVDYPRLRERLVADGQILEWAGAANSAKLEGIVVDNSVARVVGEWKTSGSVGGFVGADYLHDGDESKGTKSVTFTPRLPAAGDYEIRLWGPAGGNRAANVPVTIRLAEGERRLTVDQRNGPLKNGFVSLGPFACPAGESVSVTIGTEGTSGHVIADAVQFIPVAASGPAVEPSESLFFRKLGEGRKQAVVIYGTSLSHGGAWASATRQWFERRYPGLVTFVNGSGPGQNSDWGVANLNEKVLAHRPNLVMIEFSYNDAVDRFRMPVERGAANLEKMIAAIHDADPTTAIVLQVMNAAWDAPNGRRSSSSRPRLEEFNDNYRSAAKAHGLTLLDHYPNWLRLRESDPSQFERSLPDGSHPSKEASLAITWPTVEAWLERSR